VSIGEVHGEGGEDFARPRPEALESGVWGMSRTLEARKEGEESVATDDKKVPFAGIAVDVWYKEVVSLVEERVNRAAGSSSDEAPRDGGRVHLGVIPGARTA
jgi:hypothetical protein